MGAKRYSPPSHVTVQETTPERLDDLSKATFQVTAHPGPNPGFLRPDLLSIPTPLSFHPSPKFRLFETQQKPNIAQKCLVGFKKRPWPSQLHFSYVGISPSADMEIKAPLLSQKQENKDTCGKGRQLLS